MALRVTVKEEEKGTKFEVRGTKELGEKRLKYIAIQLPVKGWELAFQFKKDKKQNPEKASGFNINTAGSFIIL